LRISDENAFHVVAASAPAQLDGEWRRYHIEKARGFALSVSTQYQEKSVRVGSVEVTSYTFPFHPTAGEAVLDTTAKALELYSELFGAYPHDTLAVVEADFLDGMEYDGMYFLSNGFYNLYQGTPGEYLIAIAAHETAHQWFYALVGNDQGNEPWLDEALCTYSEHLFYERYYPDALDWWWTYRVNYYQPRGAVDGSIYNPEGYRAYRDAIYLNGAVFLDELRKTIGDPAFTAFLKGYVDQNRYKIATGERFFTILEQYTDANLSELRKRFFSIP
jgi:aminopeptidase N